MNGSTASSPLWRWLRNTRFQVLTKRSARMREYVSRLVLTSQFATRSDDCRRMAGQRSHLARKSGSPWRTSGLAVAPRPASCRRAHPDLLATPAAIRFVSAEPLLGAINFRRLRSAPRPPYDCRRRLRDTPPLRDGGNSIGFIVGGESGSALARCTPIGDVDPRSMRGRWRAVFHEANVGSQDAHARHSG